MTSQQQQQQQQEQFTLLHTRRLLSSNTLRLCPSMDLLFVLSSSSTSTTSTFTLYRSVTFQKLVTLTTATECTHAAWSPDGRWLACADNTGNLVLHNVEAILALSSPVVVTCMTRNDSEAIIPQQQFLSLDFAAQTKLKALLWKHRGNPHPAWSKEDDWEVPYFQPSLYCLSLKKTANLSTEHTPLSILIVISEHAEALQMHVCLHGCYPLLKHIPLRSTRNEQARVETSTNLTHIAVCIQPILNIFSIPSLQQHALHTISALYASTTTRLQQLQEALPEIRGAFQSSLKPVDMKLQGLVRLLENYGLLQQTTLRQLLVQYILSGHTRAAPNLSNAMDQFFTGVQMNDQLLQRLEQSLVVAVAHVESQCREQLWEPAQACVVQFAQLHGLARHVEADPLVEGSVLLSSEQSLQCLQGAEQLLLTVERTLVLLLEARMRLQDWMAWLRAVGAQIKARGTAPQSARHENARKRRVPDAVVKRLLQYLSESSSVVDNSSGTTESILHLEFAQMLQSNSGAAAAASWMTIPPSLQAVQRAATQLFAGPPQCVLQQMQTTQLILDDTSSLESTMAMVFRMGRGGAQGDGCYCPSSNAVSFRQWLVVAKSSNDSLELHAIPMSWDGTTSLASPHTWAMRLQLDRCDEIMALEFYSDDGKSTLSGESNGKEGSRQALAVLMRMGEDVVLSLVPYDDLKLSMQALKPMESSSWSLPQPLQTIQVQTRGSGEEEEGTVHAKTRTVANYTGPARLVLSGSRGMAAVECVQGQQVVLNLFDLEEDEENEDELDESSDA